MKHTLGFEKLLLKARERRINLVQVFAVTDGTRHFAHMAQGNKLTPINCCAHLYRAGLCVCTCNKTKKTIRNESLLVNIAYPLRHNLQDLFFELRLEVVV